MRNWGILFVLCTLSACGAPPRQVVDVVDDEQGGEVAENSAPEPFTLEPGLYRAVTPVRRTGPIVAVGREYRT